MSVLYRLIGIKINESTKTDLIHEGLDENKEFITIHEVKSYFESLDCTGSSDVLKFITDTETMKDDKKYSISLKDKRVIYVLSLDDKLKEKITNIFSSKGFVQEKRNVTKEKKINPNLSKPIPLDEIKIDESIIDDSNNETIKLFHDNDFLNLLRIYEDNPDMFKRFSSYVSSGDIILNDERFAVKSEINLEALLIEVKKLGINLEDEIISNALQKFNGHLNLTLRYLLRQKALNI